MPDSDNRQHDAITLLVIDLIGLDRRIGLTGETVARLERQIAESRSKTRLEHRLSCSQETLKDLNTRRQALLDSIQEAKLERERQPMLPLKGEGT